LPLRAFRIAATLSPFFDSASRHSPMLIRHAFPLMPATPYADTRHYQITLLPPRCHFRAAAASASAAADFAAACIISAILPYYCCRQLTLSAAAATPHYAAICSRHYAFQYAYADFRHALALICRLPPPFSRRHATRMPPAPWLAVLILPPPAHTPRFRMPAFRRRFRQNYAAHCCIR
jgi:hypothetical protein